MHVDDSAMIDDFRFVMTSLSDRDSSSALCRPKNEKAKDMLTTSRPNHTVTDLSVLLDHHVV